MNFASPKSMFNDKTFLSVKMACILWMVLAVLLPLDLASFIGIVLPQITCNCLSRVNLASCVGNRD